MPRNFKEALLCTFLMCGMMVYGIFSSLIGLE